MDLVAIRLYQPGDRESVVTLWIDGGLIGPGEDAARWLDAPASLVAVATLRGDLVGTVMVQSAGSRGLVSHVAVAPTQRRRGVGRRLMEWAEDHLAAAGCRHVGLEVQAGNEPARRFYEALGYRAFLPATGPAAAPGCVPYGKQTRPTGGG